MGIRELFLEVDSMWSKSDPSLPDSKLGVVPPSLIPPSEDRFVEKDPPPSIPL